MLIIDRNKDFYDYQSNIYGVDKTVVYDRRESIPVCDMRLVEMAFDRTQNDLYDNFKDKRVRMSHTAFLLLEIGFVQYAIKVTDVQFDKAWDAHFPTLVSCKFEIVKTYNEQRHIFAVPVSIHHLHVKGYMGHRTFIYQFPTLDDIAKVEECEYYDYILNPILAKSSLTALFSAFDVWRDIQTYISSLGNDKNVDIKMTDVGKAETHGFDKNSFRNPIKL